MAAARPRVGLIGLGGMGRGIAQNLLKNDYPAAVLDIRPEPVRDSAAQGAIPCASSAEVGAHSDIVMLIPFSYTDVRSILLEDGLLAALAPGSTIVVMATVGPAEAREVARLAAEQGVRTLDAPVSGGPHGAEQGAPETEESQAMAQVVLKDLNKKYDEVHAVKDVNLTIRDVVDVVDVVARVEPMVRTRPHEKVRLVFVPDRIHFFDPKTEAVIR
ncbi:MAG: NAD(P)-binding domain-containing protein [Candidatus Rokubacteria bacterium]|nr:NAD(P)-binding domain-containing protein [Candidatus Rokubacteria bacterium]